MKELVILVLGLTVACGVALGLWLWQRPKQKRGARLARIGGAPTSV